MGSHTIFMGTQHVLNGCPRIICGLSHIIAGRPCYVCGCARVIYGCSCVICGCASCVVLSPKHRANFTHFWSPKHCRWTTTKLYGHPRIWMEGHTFKWASMMLSLASTYPIVGTQEKFGASCVLLGYHANFLGPPRVALWARMSGAWVARRVHGARTAHARCGRMGAMCTRTHELWACIRETWAHM